MTIRPCVLLAAISMTIATMVPVAFAGDSGVIEFSTDRLLVDLRQSDWEYLARDAQWTTKVGFGRSEADMMRDAERAKTECEAVSQAEGWKPIQVGRRWEPLGHPELNDKITWLRLRFRVPDGMKDYRLDSSARRLTTRQTSISTGRT